MGANENKNTHYFKVVTDYPSTDRTIQDFINYMKNRAAYITDVVEIDTPEQEILIDYSNELKEKIKELETENKKLEKSEEYLGGKNEAYMDVIEMLINSTKED